MWQAVVWAAALGGSACPPGPAFWMPHAEIPDNGTMPLPLEPALSIACCGGVLGATPVESHHVVNIYPHNNLLYAILNNNPKITCPPHSATWPAAKHTVTAGSSHSNQVPNLDPEQFDGYVVHGNTDCAPFRTANGTAGQCAALCSRMEDCRLFSHLAPKNCRLCADKRRARESSGFTAHVKKTNSASAVAPSTHHPIVLAGVIVGFAVIVAVGATVYTSKDT